LTPDVWERDVLPRRVGAYSPAWLAELCTGGEVVWVGAGALGRSGGKGALYFREDVRLAGPPPASAKVEAPARHAHDAIRALLEDAPPSGPRLRAQAELMLERYGIVTRETVLAEGVPGGFASLYGEMSNLEMLGTARRGYFVEGLGGAQFALPGAVERLRSLPEADGSYLLLGATDPANPYGASLPWPKSESGRRPGRTPGAHLLLRDGEPVVFVERGGRGL